MQHTEVRECIVEVVVEGHEDWGSIWGIISIEPLDEDQPHVPILVTILVTTYMLVPKMFPGLPNTCSFNHSKSKSLGIGGEKRFFPWALLSARPNRQRPAQGWMNNSDVRNGITWKIDQGHNQWLISGVPCHNLSHGKKQRIKNWFYGNAVFAKGKQRLRQKRKLGKLK